MNTIELTAGQPVHGGHTLCRTEEGRIILVTGAIPGERVLCEIDESAKPWRGRVIDVLGASADRREPLGAGADLGYMTQEAQVAWKQAVLEDTISHVGGSLAEHLAERGITPCVRGVGPETGTRTRIDLDVNEAGQLCMHGRSSHELIPVTDLPLAHPSITEFMAAWSGPWPAGERVRFVAPSAQDPVAVIGGNVYLADGRQVSRKVKEQAKGYTWKVSAAGFWQTHVAAPETLIDAVVGGVRLRPSDKVAEFYGGAGLFTQVLGHRAAEVHMWEGDRKAASEAIRNAPRALIHHSSIDARVLASGAKGADVVIADPSRAGLGVKGARALASSPAVAIALVSCDPAAMARDVAAMVEAGRAVMSMDAIDLFPATMHMEVVTVLA